MPINTTLRAFVNSTHTKDQAVALMREPRTMTPTLNGQPVTSAQQAQVELVNAIKHGADIRVILAGEQLLLKLRQAERIKRPDIFCLPAHFMAAAALQISLDQARPTTNTFSN